MHISGLFGGVSQTAYISSPFWISTLDRGEQIIQCLLVLITCAYSAGVWHVKLSFLLTVLRGGAAGRGLLLPFVLRSPINLCNLFSRIPRIYSL